jgi:hypothetical protein
MEMRIVVPDAEGATSLAARLKIAFGSECIFVGGESGEVDVVIDDEPDHSIARVVDAVAGWFEQAHIATVVLWLGKRSYQLARWLPVEGRR